MNMNGFETQIKNRLQASMSKRMAEQAIYDIRNGLYGDPYRQISPTLFAKNNGTIKRVYPEIEDIIKAYNSDDYTVLREELGIEDEEDIKGQDENIDLEKADSFLEPYIEPGEEKLFEKVWLARTADNQDVYIDKDTYEHMQAHPDVNMAHIVEAIGKIKDYNGQFRIGPVDLERPIGKDNCIERTDDMQIDMLVRKGRDGQTPVVLLDKNEVEAQDTSKITIGLCKDDDGRDTMFTAFYGDLAPKEPWDRSIQDNPEKLAESKDFWDTHVLVQTSDMIDWEKSKEFQANEYQKTIVVPTYVSSQNTADAVLSQQKAIDSGAAGTINYALHAETDSKEIRQDVIEESPDRVNDIPELANKHAETDTIEEREDLKSVDYSTESVDDRFSRIIEQHEKKVKDATSNEKTKEKELDDDMGRGERVLPMFEE